LAEEGGRVAEGQVLAKLETADLDLQVRSAEAALAAAQAQLDQLQADARPEEVRAAQGQVAAAQAALDQAVAQQDQLLGGATETEIAAAQAAVRSAQANYDRVKAGPTAEEMAAAQATIDSARAALEQAQANYDRVRGRADVQMTPESLALQNATIEMQRAQANYDALVSHPSEAELAAAEAQISQAEAQLAALLSQQEPQERVAGASVAAAQAQLDIAQAQLDLLLAGATPEQVAAAAAQVEQAQVTLDSTRLAQARAVLEAPVAGEIATVDVEVGEAVSPQIPVMTLASSGRFRIEADVDEADIGWMREGQPVEITFDAFPGQKIAGEVISIAPLASMDGGVVSYRVTVESASTDLPLRSGMTANTEIVHEQREDALLVPNLAISLDPQTGLKYVAKQTPTGIERVEVSTGLTTDQFSEVLTGLAEGDTVVLSSASAREQFRQMMGSTFTGGGE
jgi:HlyD family secretion protein